MKKIWFLICVPIFMPGALKAQDKVRGAGFQINQSSQTALKAPLAGKAVLQPVFSLKEAPRKVLIPNSSVAANASFVLLLDNPSADIITQAKIYDITGAEVGVLTEETAAGSDPIRLTWNGKDRSGSLVRSGIYIYQAQAAGKVINGTVVVAR